ncbi:NAD(P)/FAD-dependent oxidoreductase [Synechococcus sp. PCC 7336]|uniref:NAD(P)/FAD-dependent oxidoreductase n=1 Tax=Synechococcus sp. PCC 7336 TaxID=195250 RepID=UPI0003482C67|nr:NAD(P)/FAD-dependent oxidoreductase [Synechococcus sp. PCC 7336]
MKRQLKAVVVGAGFGGMQAAQSLAKLGLEILLIDRNNYSTFIPLLYQVAAAQLEPEQIAYPIRTLVRHSTSIRFLMAEVHHINFSRQTIETEDAIIPYDFLVLATGSRTQFLGVPGAAQYALSMRNFDEAIAIRNHILQCFERANRSSDANRRQQLLTFSIVGGGPTGIEMAGALVELKGALRRDYPELDFQQIRIILLQSGNAILADLPPSLGRYTFHKLRQKGVEIQLQARVSQVTPTSIHLHSGMALPTATVIWTAGQEASIPRTSAELRTAAKGKLVVLPTLQLESHPNVYVIGDSAHVLHRGKPLAGVAPEALQQGVAVARNIARQLAGKTPRPFHYFNKGRLAIIGCYSGVGQIGPFSLTGFLPWLMWLVVHFIYLPGFRSRLLVLFSWLHNYIFQDRAIRLILGSRSDRKIVPERAETLRLSLPKPGFAQTSKRSS